MDQLRFLESCDLVLRGEREQNGIGTLGEKTLHAVLKAYFEPLAVRREVPVGRYVADIVGEDGIIEIQTGSFTPLRPKLTAFLEAARVTVVYPVARRKWLSVIDPATGEEVSRRRSPKAGRVLDVLPELYRIEPFLTHPNFHLCVLLMDWIEIRLPVPKSRRNRRGYARQDRIPLSLEGEAWFRRPEDYLQLLPDPEGLPDPFTSRDAAEAAGLRPGDASGLMGLLYRLGLARRVGKSGNAYLYALTVPAAGEVPSPLSDFV
ncbi:MAG: hypothetical protein ACOYKJ_08365 [Candidatus Howiella sp.]|jgi:hypothetical protein